MIHSRTNYFSKRDKSRLFTFRGLRVCAAESLWRCICRTYSRVFGHTTDSVCFEFKHEMFLAFLTNYLLRQGIRVLCESAMNDVHKNVYTPK